MVDRYLKFVPFHAVEDHLRLGWAEGGSLEGTYHDQWAIIMVWQCDCPVVTPALTIGPPKLKCRID